MLPVWLDSYCFRRWCSVGYLPLTNKYSKVILECLIIVRKYKSDDSIIIFVRQSKELNFLFVNWLAKNSQRIIFSFRRSFFLSSIGSGQTRILSFIEYELVNRTSFSQIHRNLGYRDSRQSNFIECIYFFFSKKSDHEKVEIKRLFIYIATIIITN